MTGFGSDSARGVFARPKAKLLILEGDTGSGYRSQHNEIHIVLGGWDLEEVGPTSDASSAPSEPPAEGWPIWEQHLHHEFVHEYQDKVVNGHVSEQGQALDDDPTIRRFDGPGHDAAYYTAAAEIATALGFNVADFVNAL